MIAHTASISHQNEQDAHQRFLSMLPLIRQQASVAFAGKRPEQREEMIAEVIANAYCAFARLVERGKMDVVYPTPLAQFAIRQARTGRRVGGALNVRDVSSRYCQRAKEVTVERLDRFDQQAEAWEEILVEDKRATPADIAAWRMDFAQWLRRLSSRSRRIARTLSTGESTAGAAKRHHVSAGRISQIRRELQDHWRAFQGEQAMEAAGA